MAFPYYGQPDPLNMNPFEAPGMFGQTESASPYSGPFNVNMSGMFGNEIGPIMQLLGPSIAQNAMGPGQRMMQFMPTQNIYDQMQSQRYFQGQMKAAGFGAQRDVQSLRQLFGGTWEMAQGRALSDQQKQQAFDMAKQASGMLPMMEAVLGPEMIDSMMGTTGSATVMSHQMFKTMSQGFDPVTGAVGARPESAANVAANVFEQLYGPGSDPSKVRGIKAGSMGSLYSELYQRGMMGDGLGTLGSMNERYSAVARTLIPDKGMIHRMAEQSIRGQELMRDPDKASAADWTGLEREVGGAIKSLKTDVGAGGKPSHKTVEAIEKLGISGGIIEAGQADRITQRLKGLTGTVNAMRDIFGDMGKPNAPMREIINGLEALTQGQLANMSPGAAETMVRTSYNLAKQSGIGMQGMLGLSAQGAARADQLGVSRALVPFVEQGTMAFGAAANAVQSTVPSWGRLSTQEQMIHDQNLRFNFLASSVGNYSMALRRMKERTPGFKAGSEAARMVQAMESGETSYTDSAGRTHEIGFETDARGERVRRGRESFLRLAQDAGVSRELAVSMFADKAANQEFGQSAQMGNWGRKMTAEMDWKNTMGVMARQRLEHEATATKGTLLGRETAFGRAASAAGVDLRRLSRDTGLDFAERAFALGDDPKTLDDPTARAAALQTGMRESLKASLRKQGKSDRAVDQLSDKDVGQLAGEMEGTWNVHLGAITGEKNWMNTARLGSKRTLELAEKERAQAERVGELQSAMSGLGRAGPMERVIDALKSADKDTTFGSILSKAFGGINIAELEKKDKALGWYHKAVDRAKSADLGTPEGRAAAAWETANIKAATFGGEAASKRGETLALELKTAQAEPASPAQRDKVERIQEAIKMEAEAAHSSIYERYRAELKDKVVRVGSRKEAYGALGKLVAKDGVILVGKRGHRERVSLDKATEEQIDEAVTAREATATPEEKAQYRELYDQADLDKGEEKAADLKDRSGKVAASRATPPAKESGPVELKVANATIRIDGNDPTKGVLDLVGTIFGTHDGVNLTNA